LLSRKTAMAVSSWVGWVRTDHDYSKSGTTRQAKIAS
jgi:hypothetical protein